MVKNEIDNVRFNFLYIDTYSFGPTWVYPESVVPYNMLRYIISGEGVFCIDDEEVKVKKMRLLTFHGDVVCHAIRSQIIFHSVVSDSPQLYSLRAETSLPIIMESRG